MKAVIKDFEKACKSNNAEDLQTLLELCLAFLGDKGYAPEFGAYLIGFAAKLTNLEQEKVK